MLPSPGADRAAAVSLWPVRAVAVVGITVAVVVVVVVVVVGIARSICQ